MQSNLWFPVKPEFPKLEKNISCDVAVIGAGIAGISCAYFLQEKGFDVAVIEKDEIGSAATGASSGILFQGSGEELNETIELMGEKKTRVLWDETRESIEGIKKITEAEGIECDLRKTGSVNVALNEGQAEQLRKEAEAHEKFGLKAEFLEGKELENFFSLKEFPAGLKNDYCFQVRPAHFALGLAEKNNMKIFQQTEMLEIESTEHGVKVKTNGGTIDAKKAVITTNLRPFFGLEKYFKMENSAIIAGQKMPEEKLNEIFPENAIVWTQGANYDILYPRDERIALEVYELRTAKEKIPQYFPGIEFRKEIVFGDSWAKTNDTLPLIGKVKENIFAAIAMGDQGIVMGFTAGRKIASALEGKKDSFLEMCSPERFSASNNG